MTHRPQAARSTMKASSTAVSARNVFKISLAAHERSNPKAIKFPIAHLTFGFNVNVSTPGVS